MNKNYKVFSDCAQNYFVVYYVMEIRFVNLF